MTTELRALSVTVDQIRSSTNPIDVGEHPGVVVEIELAMISGTTPNLQVGVQKSIDNAVWTDAEGSVALSTPRVCRLERHQLHRFLRVVHTLSGTSAAATFAIRMIPLASYSYNTPTAAWRVSPIVQGTNANFDVSGVAGALVSWVVNFLDSGAGIVSSASGSGTCDANGQFAGVVAVPVDPAIVEAELIATLQAHSAGDIVPVTV